MARTAAVTARDETESELHQLGRECYHLVQGIHVSNTSPMKSLADYGSSRSLIVAVRKALKYSERAAGKARKTLAEGSVSEL